MDINQSKNLKFYILCIVFVSFSCQQKDRKFDNPQDPNRDPEKSITTSTINKTDGSSGENEDTSSTDSTVTTSKTSGGSGGNNDTSSTDSTVTNPDDSVEENICLTGNCNPPEGTSFDFSNTFSVTPAGCTQAKRVRVFDTGSDLMVFINVLCSDRHQVYSIGLNYDGVQTRAPALLTSDCNTGTDGVTDFEVDQGTNGYLLLYVCKTASSSYRAKVVPVGSNGSAGTSVLYETLTSGDEYYHVSWNSTGSTYGVIRPSQFQRFNESGSTVGGAITVGSSDEAELPVFGDKWFAVYRYDGNTGCSKVASNGVLQCNNVSLGSSYSYYYRLLNDSTAIKADSNYNRIYRLSFNSSTCAISDESALASLTNVNISKVFNAISINSSIGALLYSTNKNQLIMVTFPKSGSFVTYSESGVASFATLNSARMKIIHNKIYVAFDKDGVGYVTYSAENAQ